MMLKSARNSFSLAALATLFGLLTAPSTALAGAPAAVLPSVAVGAVGQSQPDGKLWLVGPYRSGYDYRYPYYDYPSPPYSPYYGGYDYTPTPPPRRGSCWRWKRRCEANWGFGNEDYWGCMRYHGCH